MRDSEIFLFTFVISDNYRDKCFHKILTLVKEREKVTLSIFYPKKWHNGTIEHKLRKKKLVVVEKNLFSGKYTNSPWRFIKDVNEVFETIKSSYTKKSMIYIAANEVSRKISRLLSRAESFFDFKVSGSFLMSNGQPNGRVWLLLWTLVCPASACHSLLRR